MGEPTRPPHYHFVTGRLAEPLVRRTVERLAHDVGFAYSVQVLNISVAALMTAEWVARRIEVPPGTDSVFLPGWCRGELDTLAAQVGTTVLRGPKDIRALPEHFGRRLGPPEDYGGHSIEIVAEINHAPRLPRDKLLATALALRDEGADVIDLGCEPGYVWSDIDQAVRALCDVGLRVSVDSYHPDEIGPAVAAGAELVLSVNRTNREHAIDWPAELVVVPDEPSSLAGIDQTLELLHRHGRSVRIDPILEPIGFGFATSLLRYAEARRRWPEMPMMMGIGNLTELTDVDSAGVNLILLSICQELGVGSVLTTSVINWARSAVRECDLARRLVYYAVTHQTLPKHLDDRLIMLRDPRLLETTAEELEQLAAGVRDRNVRLLTHDGQLHAINGLGHFVDDDPFRLFAALEAADPKGITPSHAFYLGYEMAKAVTALTLGKNYVQDESLRWGHLTRTEQSHRGRKDSADSNDSP